MAFTPGSRGECWCSAHLSFLFSPGPHPWTGVACIQGGSSPLRRPSQDAQGFASQVILDPIRLTVCIELRADDTAQW